MKQKKQYILIALAIFCIISCQKKENNFSNSNNYSNTELREEEHNEGKIVLGEKLPNPYEYSNMQKAYENIKSNFSEFESFVKVTHEYVKIKPKDELELSRIKQDKEIILFSYPLDYPIVKNGTYYFDDSIKCDTCVTYQYSSIKLGKIIPDGIEYEVLAKLYIPEEDINLDNYSNQERRDIFEDALIHEAFNIVGLEVENNLSKKIRGKWTPAGTIKVFDDYNNTDVAVEGVVVRATRWFTTHTGMTNSSGSFTCNGNFKYEANYSIQWDRLDFSIRSGTYGQAVYNGPKQKGNWNLTLTTNPDMFYARIFRAAYQYYYTNIDNLSRPPLNNNIFDPQLKIAAFNQTNALLNGRTSPHNKFLGLGNFLKIYNPERTIKDIHGTTIHELAHAAHWKICSPKSKFNDADDKVKESWASGVEWYLTKKYYPNYFVIYSDNYTGIVEDMIDGIDPTNQDQVVGYSITEIEQGVKNKKVWDDWKDNIKNNTNNATENYLDILFGSW